MISALEALRDALYKYTITSTTTTTISISLKLCLYDVPFLRYSASKNGVTLKLGVEVVQGH